VTTEGPDVRDDFAGVKAIEEADGEPADAAQDEDTVQQMAELLENARDNLFQGKIAEAVKQMVSVLAAYDRLGDPPSRASELANQAQTELTKMESAIAIEPDSAWLGDDMMQKFGTTLDLSLQPAVMITYRGETGRSLVSNVPVSFEFVAGSGILTAVVNTDEFGTASCNIARLDNSQEENIVRASLVIRAEGYTYRFKGVERDFIYRPPSRKATILVLERSPLGVSDDPFIMDPVFNRIKELEFDFSLYNGVLSPDDFMRVYEGELKTIERLGLAEDVSYLVVVLNDSYSVRQVELDGKKYNIFVSEARATTRIVRVGDGKIMFQVAVERSKRDSNHGQGGSEEKAVWDVQDKISADMADALENNFAEIREVMLGDEG
jgi:hypothetical protein